MTDELQGTHRSDGEGSFDDIDDPRLLRDRLAAVVESSDDAIFTKDPEARITSWNPGAERLYGYTRDEMIGRSVTVLFPPERIGEEKEILGRVLAGGRQAPYETQRLTKDGRIIDVSLSASPIHDSNDNVVGASVIARDITAQKQSRVTESILGSIVESSDDAIYSKDSMAKVTTWNPAAERLYGYSAEEMIGTPIARLVPADLQGDDKWILEKIMAGERFEHFETRRVRKDGREIDVSLTISPIRDADGAIVGASIIARDVGERKRLDMLERELEQRDFIARAAHELRNPVTTMTGFAETLIEHQNLAEQDVERALYSIARQGQRMQELVSDLLDLTYIQSGRYTVTLEPIEVASIVAEVLEDSAAPEDKSVTVDLPEGIMVLADRVRLAQVFVNLVTNAYKYGGTEILIDGEVDSAWTSIRVCDNGHGVPDGIRTSLFQPFARGHVGPPGSGLGLSIARRLVEASGGGLWYEVTPDGPCFVMRLRSGARRAAGA